MSRRYPKPDDSEYALSETGELLLWDDYFVLDRFGLWTYQVWFNPVKGFGWVKKYDGLGQREIYDFASLHAPGYFHEWQKIHRNKELPKKIFAFVARLMETRTQRIIEIHRQIGKDVQALQEKEQLK